MTLNQTVPTDGVGAMTQWQKAFSGNAVVSAGADWRWVDGDSNEDAYNQLGGLVSPVTPAVLALRRVSGGTQNSVGAFVQDILTPLPKLSSVIS